jgi:hypothetical protein
LWPGVGGGGGPATRSPPEAGVAATGTGAGSVIRLVQPEAPPVAACGGGLVGWCRMRCSPGFAALSLAGDAGYKWDRRLPPPGAQPVGVVSTGVGFAMASPVRCCIRSGSGVRPGVTATGTGAGSVIPLVQPAAPPEAACASYKSETTTEAQYQMQSGFFLDVIVRECSPVFQLLAGESQSLLIRWDTFFVLDLLLDVHDRVARLHIQSNRLTSQRLYEDLHGAAKVRYRIFFFGFLGSCRFLGEDRYSTSPVFFLFSPLVLVLPFL